MSSTNSFSPRSAASSGSPSGPDGFGVSNVWWASHQSCQRSLDVLGEGSRVPERGSVGRRVGCLLAGAHTGRPAYGGQPPLPGAECALDHLTAMAMISVKRHQQHTLAGEQHCDETGVQPQFEFGDLGLWRSQSAMSVPRGNVSTTFGARFVTFGARLTAACPIRRCSDWSRYHRRPLRRGYAGTDAETLRAGCDGTGLPLLDQAVELRCVRPKPKLARVSIGIVPISIDELLVVERRVVAERSSSSSRPTGSARHSWSVDMRVSGSASDGASTMISCDNGRSRELDAERRS